MSSQVRHLFIDIETYSSADLSECGAYKYAESEDFEILLFAFSFDGEPVRVVDLSEGEALEPYLQKAIFDPTVRKVAHNAAFERVCLSRYFGEMLDPDQWECTMIRALSLGLPASLKDVGSALGLDKQKMTEGKDLIRLFCQPDKNGEKRKKDPEKWRTFVEYNRRDVETEIEIWQRLRDYPTDPHEHDLYVMDQKINDYGILVDEQLIDEVLAYNGTYKKDLEDECVQLCGLRPTMIGKMKSWVEEQEGITLSGLRADDIKRLLGMDLKPETRRVLEIRKEAGRSSVSKYEKFKACICKDGRIHGAFLFCGAGRTGRWAGRLIQPQNFPRNGFDDVELARSMVKAGRIEDVALLYPSLSEVFSTLVRTLVIAPEGKTLAVADYSAIEARVIAWLAKEKWRQEVFANGGDIYCASASQMFKVPVEKHGQNAHLRKQGKIAELALGYGGGVNALRAFGADKMGLSENEMQSIVSKWRQASPHIVNLWKQLGDAAFKTIRTGIGERCECGVEFFMQGEILFMKIPSGRCLAYFKPAIEDGQITYYSPTGRVKTFGGKLVENCIQATARDCLACAMERIGYPIVMHIHDEVVVEVPDENCLKEVEGIMSNGLEHSLNWCPDLVLTADGFTSPFYRKE